MKKKVLSVLMVFMMCLGLTGCGGSSGDDISTYTYSSELDIKNLDSSDADDQCPLRAIHAVIDGLMKTDKKGNIAYGIAKSEEVSEDGLTHTYKLRKDAKWSDGSAVTSADFVNTIKRSLDGKTSKSIYADMLSPIVGATEAYAGTASVDNVGVTAPDDYTIEFKLVHIS